MSNPIYFPEVHLKEGICVPFRELNNPKLIGFTFLVHLKGLHL